MPCANWPRMSAVAGATRSRSMRWATAMCSMALSTLAGEESSAPNISVITFFPVSAAKVRGVMNSRAERVITTWMSSFSCWRRRTSSAALYAATPPVTPSAIFMELSAAFCVAFFRSLWQLGQFVLQEALLQFLFGDARSLARLGIINHRAPAYHQLPGAAGDDHDISKLTIRHLSESSHGQISLRRTSEFHEFAVLFEQCGSASRARWPGLRVQPDRDRH